MEERRKTLKYQPSYVSREAHQQSASHGRLIDAPARSHRHSRHGSSVRLLTDSQERSSGSSWSEESPLRAQPKANVRQSVGEYHKTARRSHDDRERFGGSPSKEPRSKRRPQNEHIHSKRLSSGLYATTPTSEKHPRPRSKDYSSYHARRKPPQRKDKASPLCPSCFRNASRCCIITTIILVLLLLIIIIVPAAVVASRKHSKADSSHPSNSNLQSINESSIPEPDRGTYLDPFTWYDTTDFNVTYTNATVGGLPVMGLNSTWSDTTRANPSTPPLTSAWEYGTRRMRGINLGGWLSMEPFITPSFFSASVPDEWTLTSTLGANASATLEKHYATFITEADFSAIASAGFDHVRIPFSYWAVTTYPDDPYVARISWRYLLRGLEWARRHGLRVNLDLHGAPGSQNGWNHSGRQGPIDWLVGPDGALNANRTLDIHRQLTAFFAQPRYANLVTLYGVLNEPNMIAIAPDEVIAWTRSALDIVRGSGMPASLIVVVGDGFLAIPTWNTLLRDAPGVLLDVHEYVVFNAAQLALNHTAKLEFACAGWSQQVAQAMDPNVGFGNFVCGEWSQADTDCAPNVNNAGAGSRWEGTLDTGNATTSVLRQSCATGGQPACSCEAANADYGQYSAEYKTWLRMFAEAQMHSFEQGWGWFYWTWKTESATQWSWQRGLQAGILPKNAAKRDFDCDRAVPDFEAQGLSETY